MSDWIDVLAALIALLMAAAIAYRSASQQEKEAPAEVVVSKLLVYPIKSCSGVEVGRAIIEKRGFRHDRTYMLVSPTKDGWENHHIARNPLNSLIRTEIKENDILICSSPRANGEFSISLSPSTEGCETLDIVMHQSPVQGLDMGEKAAAWFTQACGQATRLVYLPRHAARPVLGNVFGQVSADRSESRLTFADCASYLITSQSSLDAVSEMLGREMSILPLRPNILVKATEGKVINAFEEDYWAEMTIGRSGATFRLTANCARCTSIDIDYRTGTNEYEKGKKYPLKAMMKTRRVDSGMKYSPVFGRYAFSESEGKSVSTGDVACISKRNKERSTFIWPGMSTGT